VRRAEECGVLDIVTKRLVRSGRTGLQGRRFLVTADELDNTGSVLSRREYVWS
jgi:hypothetical protein